MNAKSYIAWTLAAFGLGAGVAAAALHGGWFAGLTAASAGLTSMAGVLGYTNKAG